MNLQKSIFTFSLFISSIICYSQDYFVVENDTTFCSNLEYGTTGQGYLKSVRYKDENGKNIVIEGRKNVPDVLTFYRQEVTIDKIPLNADKPKSYIRYTPRAVDGKLKIYERIPAEMSASKHFTNAPNPLTMDNSTAFRPNKGMEMETKRGHAGKYKFFIKLPNGIFYKINSKKNMKKNIIPYLQECEEFKNQYKGDYSYEKEPFIEMIELYNSICK